MTDPDRLTGQGKLLFGAGFVFGVTATLIILAVVLVGVTNVAGGGLVTVVATTGGGIVFAAIVGAGLYYLAFPENRTRVAVDPAKFGFDDEK
jgi:hypothetical protein